MSPPLLTILFDCSSNIFERTWYSLVLALIKRLSPKAPPSNGLETITKNWHNPSDSTSLLSPWPKDFSRDIIPKSCHSHNDYARNIPLYDALAVGCSSVEADIWLRHDVDGNEVLLVGHTSRSLTSDRSLSALYLDPLLQILNNQNNPDPYPTEAQHQTLQPAGIFSSYPNTTTVLLLDFKEDSATLFPAVVNALEPFRQKGYLTTYANDTLTTGPLTIVASGLASLSDVTSPNTTLSRSIFLDAPLDSLSSSLYNTTNSYYASLSLSKAVGYLWAGKFSSKQVETVKEQISAAEEKGLKSRYWGTISWPIPWRMGTWKTLMENGVSVLNVDDLESAGRWDWAVCVVASFALCGW